MVETPVGDRNVLDVLEQRNLVLGGEQSGHVIFADHATTGDGTLTGILLLDTMVAGGRPLSELAAVMTRVPQVLRNVAVADPDVLDGDAAFWSRVRDVDAELGDDGRVLVRPSGTEPVVRVMVEATDAEAADEAADRLVELVEHAAARAGRRLGHGRGSKRAAGPRRLAASSMCGIVGVMCGIVGVVRRRAHRTLPESRSPDRARPRLPTRSTATGADRPRCRAPPPGRGASTATCAGARRRGR